VVFDRAALPDAKSSRPECSANHNF